MKLKTIKGGRDAFEEALLKEIWLGDPEEADRMIGLLRSLPKGDLKLVNPDPGIKTTPGEPTG